MDIRSERTRMEIEVVIQAERKRGTERRIRRGVVTMAVSVAAAAISGVWVWIWDDDGYQVCTSSVVDEVRRTLLQFQRE